MDMPINVPVDDPNADTEWNDILRQHGVIPEKPPSPTPIIEEAILSAREKAHANRLEDKTLDELDALEDEEDEDFLSSYRTKRLQELSAISAASTHGQLYPLQKVDYQRDVTEASQDCFVVVLLTGKGDESQLAEELFREIARTFGDVKFCVIRAQLCIEGYPERNTPTVLVYKDGDIRRQLVTLKELNGTKTTVRDLERLLVDVGAVTEGDVRLEGRKGADEGEFKSVKPNGGGLRQGNIAARVEDEDEDSDWD